MIDKNGIAETENTQRGHQRQSTLPPPAYEQDSPSTEPQHGHNAPQAGFGSLSSIGSPLPSPPSGAPHPNLQHHPSSGYLTSPPLSHPTGSSQQSLPPPHPWSYETQPPQPLNTYPKPPTLSQADIGERYRSEQFALCAQGKHQPATKYGVLGIVCAILFFPIGFICMCLDTEERCTRCGNVL